MVLGNPFCHADRRLRHRQAAISPLTHLGQRDARGLKDLFTSDLGLQRRLTKTARVNDAGLDTQFGQQIPQIPGLGPLSVERSNQINGHHST